MKKGILIMFLACSTLCFAQTDSVMWDSSNTITEYGAIKNESPKATNLQELLNVSETETGQDQIFEKVKNGLMGFLHLLDIVFIILLFIIGWLFTDVPDNLQNNKLFKWWFAVPNTFRVLIASIILVIVYLLLGMAKTSVEIFSIFVSTITAMVIFKLGINKVFEWITSRIFPNK